MQCILKIAVFININSKFFLVPCTITSCPGSNVQCTNNADATKTCTCNSGHVAISGNVANGCNRK